MSTDVTNAGQRRFRRRLAARALPPAPRRRPPAAVAPADREEALRARLAHRLRQPLQAIMMLAREARREPSPGRADELLAHLIQAGDELNLQIAGWLSAPAGRQAGASPLDGSPTPAVAGGSRAPATRPTTGNGVARPSEEAGRANAAAGGHGRRLVPADDPHARRVLLIDAHDETRAALERGLVEIGCSVTGVASARAAIGELISFGDRMPDRIIVNSRSRGEPLQQTLLGIGHVLQARVPIVVLSGDLLAGSGQEPDREWRSLGVVTVAPRPRSLDALRRLLVS